MPHPWVSQAVGKVPQDKADQKQEARDHDDRHHDRVVLGASGLEGQSAHARPGEDLLDDHCAGDERGQQSAQGRDKREQRVPQGVDVEHRALAEALGVGGANEVLPDHIERFGPHIAGVIGNAGQAQRKHRADQVGQTIGQVPLIFTHREHAADREQAELHRQHQDE